MRSIHDFIDVADDCGRMDLGYEGYKFTFDNRRRDTENIQCRVDRGLASVEWVDCFPLNLLTHLPRNRIFFDHAPIRIDLARMDRRQRNRLLRFEKMWTHHQE